MTVSLKKVIQDLPSARRARIEARAADLSKTHGKPRASDRARYRVYKDAANCWRWQLVASNGAVIATSGEGYRSRSGCLASITRVRAAADAAVSVDV